MGTLLGHHGYIARHHGARAPVGTLLGTRGYIARHHGTLLGHLLVRC